LVHLNQWKEKETQTIKELGFILIVDRQD